MIKNREIYSNNGGVSETLGRLSEYEDRKGLWSLRSLIGDRRDDIGVISVSGSWIIALVRGILLLRLHCYY